MREPQTRTVRLFLMPEDGDIVPWELGFFSLSRFEDAFSSSYSSIASCNHSHVKFTIRNIRQFCVSMCKSKKQQAVHNGIRVQHTLQSP